MFDTECFLSQLATHNEQVELSIAWCAEYGMPEVAAKMVRNVGGALEFQQALKRRAATELRKLYELETQVTT